MLAMVKARNFPSLLFLCFSCVLVFVTSLGTGNFNLFLNEAETRRLLGVPGELYYARNGFVNDYALSFTPPIKTEVTEIHFDWFNEHPPYLPETKMFYAMAFSISNQHAMYQPLASIPNNGTVPTKPSDFSISLLCTGLLSVEVEVKIQLNVSTTPSNLISLDIRRKKPCLRGVQQSRPVSQQRLQPEPTTVVGMGDSVARETEKEEEEEEEKKEEKEEGKEAKGSGGRSSRAVLYVGVGCSLAAVVIIVVIVLVLYVTYHRSKNNSQSGASINDKELSDEPDSLMASDLCHPALNSTNNAGDGLGRWRTSPRVSTIDRTLPTGVLGLLSAIRIEPCRLSVKEIVMQGDYGRIYRGSLITGTGDLDEKEVLVKTVAASERSERERVERMIIDGCRHQSLQHENVHSVVAACVDGFGQTLLIYPHLDEGFLKIYLQNKRQSNTFLSIEQLMCFAIQLAAAISYLHRNDVVHGDIATRNCLVDSCQSVRLADNALASDIFPLDYDEEGREEGGVTGKPLIPTRWMAIEALTDNIITPASDVWSFGITLWELVTFAQQPYPRLESSDILSYLQQGYRLAQPTGCTRDLYAMMLQCWTPEVKNRPTISHLQTSLHNFGTSLVRNK